MKAKLDLKGLDKYLASLEQMNLDMNQVCADALKTGAERAVRGMKKRVAVDTGDLKKSIIVGDIKIDGNDVSIEFGVLTDDPEIRRYAHFQEYGSSSMPAHPFIRPTMAEDKRGIKSAMINKLKKIGVQAAASAEGEGSGSEG